MPAMIVEFEDVSATMKGTVIKVERNTGGREGYFYFGPEYMEEFDGGSFALSAGQELPAEIGLLPDGEREALRENLFPKDEDEDGGDAEE